MSYYENKKNALGLKKVNKEVIWLKDSKEQCISRGLFPKDSLIHLLPNNKVSVYNEKGFISKDGKSKVKFKTFECKRGN
jgi:hypothetical protein